MILSAALAWFGAKLPPAAMPGALADEEPPRPIAIAPRLEPVIALPPPAPPSDRLWDLRAVSPRRFAEIIHDLYMSKLLTWEQYCLVGFPSELHPDYDATIGALTGERARPDKRRDMLSEWESRVEFERRYNRQDREVRRVERVVTTLMRHRHGFIALTD